MLHLAILQTRIPLEVLDKVAGLLDRASLPLAALVCSRWQLLCQRRLFTHFSIDPSEEHGIYHSQHSHLPPVIKKLTLRGNEWSDLNRGFNDFLHRLTRLETITFAGREFCWDKLSPRSISAFQDSFALHSLVAIKLYSRGTFPLSFLSRCGPNLKRLEILGANTTLESPTGLKLAGPSTPIYLDSLSLTGNDNIDQVRQFVLGKQAATYISFAQLHTLNIVYDDFGDNPHGGELVGMFLGSFGESVQCLRIQFDLDMLAGAQTGGTIPTAHLANLTNVLHLTVNIGIHGLTIEDPDIETPICHWLVPFLGNLPSAHPIEELNIDIQLFFDELGHPCIDDVEDVNTVLNRLASNIDTNPSFLRLQAVNFRLDLYREGDMDLSPWAEPSTRRFPQLEAKNIKAIYRWSDPNTRSQALNQNSKDGEGQGW